MLTLKLNGFFINQGVKKAINGKINLNEYNEFEGIINRDSETIKGIYLKGYGIEKLVLFKFHQHPEGFSNLFCNLLKKDEDNLLGKYIGEWKVANEKDLKEPLNPKQTFEENVKKMRSNIYTEGYAEVTLSE